MDENGASDRFALAVHDGITWHVVYGTTNPNIGEWYFLAFTDNGTTSKLYVNSVQEGGNLAYSIVSEGNNIYLGATATSSVKNLNGSIDDVMIFNRSLSSTEIETLMTKQ